MAAHAAVRPAAAQRHSALRWAAMVLAAQTLNVQAEEAWAEAAQHTQQEAEAEHMLVGMTALQPLQRAEHWQRYCWLVLAGG